MLRSQPTTSPLAIRLTEPITYLKSQFNVLDLLL